MKTLFVALFLLVFFILSIPMFLILHVIGKKNPRKKVLYSQQIVVSALRMILAFCGVKTTVIGLENIPKEEPVLFVFNHRSYFDILIAYTTVTTLAGFVAKKEIEKVPFLRVWMRNLNCLFLDRDNTREGLKTILKGIDHIKNGYSIFIAPEGTRNKQDSLLPFKEGSLKIAEKSKCPIIPVSMNNTDSIFEKHLPWIRKAHVVIEYGEPILIQNLSSEDQKFLGSYVQKVITKTLDKNAPLVSNFSR